MNRIYIKETLLKGGNYSEVIKNKVYGKSGLICTNQILKTILIFFLAAFIDSASVYGNDFFAGYEVNIQFQNQQSSVLRGKITDITIWHSRAQALLLWEQQKESMPMKQENSFLINYRRVN